MPGSVVAVSVSGSHTFTKSNQLAIRLIAGLGVEGDAHLGESARHRSLVRKDAAQPNLRQVHLVHEELQKELRAAGFAVSAGTVGENITTRDLDLLTLPTGTRLHLGDAAIIEVTGLRKPCRQLDGYQQGLTAAVLGRDAEGNPLYKCGVMAVVIAGGEVKPGDAIGVILPPLPHRRLEPV
jgi:MOSC domain-containing protein YiiM